VPDRAVCRAGSAGEALGITGDLDGTSLAGKTLRIEHDPGARRIAWATTPRIGIRRATDWPLRFVARGSPWLSR
jgi:3-methyladenine DNA glycosylase Mpg